MHDPQLETQYSRQAPPALLRISPSPTTLNRREAPGPFEYGIRELAHDARNLVSALDLYCELLATPGVLAPGFEHYAEDLRRVAGSGARLIEALAGTPRRTASRYPDRGRSMITEPGTASSRALPAPRFTNAPTPYISDLGAELAALEAPLRALAGPEVRLEVECAPCAGRLALAPQELLRILFNLVANAVEATAATPPELRRRPFIRINAQRGGGASFLGLQGDRRSQAEAAPDDETVVLSVRDNGPGIAPGQLQHIFDAGFSTRDREDGDDSHGLGLSIVRQLVATAGGAVRAVSPTGLGARFDVELPLLDSGGWSEVAGSPEGEKILNFQQIYAQIEKEA